MSDSNASFPLQSVKEKGINISPSLPEKIANYLIDIDGTICDDIPNEEVERMLVAEPYPEAVKTINKWYNEGNIITFFTSRTENHRELTINWLQQSGIKYHNLIMNKPRGGNYYWIDSRKVESISYKDRFREIVKKGLTPKQ